MPNEIIKPPVESGRNAQEDELFEQVVSETVPHNPEENQPSQDPREQEVSLEETRKLLQFRTNKQIPNHPLPKKIASETEKRAEVAKLISATGEGYDMAAFLESNFKPDSGGKINQVDDHLDQAA